MWFDIARNYISREAFKGERMSVDWASRCSAEESRGRWAANKPKGIVRFGKKVCDDQNQICEYMPIPASGEIPENAAHCDVVGPKPTDVRDAFASASEIVLGCPD
jgi:hypothetical protein